MKGQCKREGPHNDTFFKLVYMGDITTRNCYTYISNDRTKDKSHRNSNHAKPQTFIDDALFDLFSCAELKSAQERR